MNDPRMITRIFVKNLYSVSHNFQIFNDADFVGWQGTFRRIAASFMSMVSHSFRSFPIFKCLQDSMGIVAVKVDGVIFLSETEKRFVLWMFPYWFTWRYGEHDSRWDEEEPFYEGFSKFKMTQVMTTPIDGRKDHKKPIDNRPTFEVINILRQSTHRYKIQIMIRSELVNSSMNESIPLFVGSSVEALTKEGDKWIWSIRKCCSGEPVEFKTIHKAAKFWKKNGKDGAAFRWDIGYRTIES